MKMKQKYLAIILMIGAGLFTACTFDDFESEPGKWEPQTETWTVNIEPEYVMGYSFWGSCCPQMEAFNEKAGQMNFCTNEIEGFVFEEGYRYYLKVDATTTNPMIMDGPSYTFKLNKVLQKEYVGISTEGRRDVTMDVRTVRMVPPDGDSSQGFYYLCGRTRDGSEKLDMGFQEIYGMDYNQFFESAMRTGSDDSERYSCHVQLSITPCERSIFNNHQYRIRMEHMLGQSWLAGDSVVVASTKEEYNTKYNELN